MPKKKSASKAGMIALLLETLPGECKIVLETYNDMLQGSPDGEEKQKNEIRIYCYIRVLAEAEIISEAEACILEAYYLPEW